MVSGLQLNKHTQTRFWFLLVLSFVVAGAQYFTSTQSNAFSPSFTRSATNSAKGQLERCRPLAGAKKHACVASALDNLASRISRKPDYRPAARIIRRAAAKVRATKSKSRAIKAVRAAKSQLLRTGLVEYKTLATVMDTAKSVLRS